MNTTISVHLSSNRTHRHLERCRGNGPAPFAVLNVHSYLTNTVWHLWRLLCCVSFHCSIILCVLIPVHLPNCLIWTRISTCTFQVTTHTENCERCGAMALHRSHCSIRLLAWKVYVDMCGNILRCVFFHRSITISRVNQCLSIQPHDTSTKVNVHRSK